MPMKTKSIVVPAGLSRLKDILDTKAKVTPLTYEEREKYAAGLTKAALGSATSRGRSNQTRRASTGGGLVRCLTPAELPPGSLLAIFNDVHIGIHDDAALRLAVECCEAEGVTHVIQNGDNHDCGPVSSHELKARAAALTNGSLLEEAASGRWFTDWCVTRPCWYGTGNHEDWINDLALRTNTVGSVTVASALGLPGNMEVLPHGYQIRIGSLVIEHGDVTLGRGSGGVNIAQAILNRFPDQTTIVGHYHRIAQATRTSTDADGIFRSHAAFVSGHLSDPTAHMEYAGRAPNWQQGFTLVRVWYDGGKPRYTIHLVEIHRNRYGRPVFEYNGRVYGR